jgi:hypothetical protein
MAVGDTFTGAQRYSSTGAAYNVADATSVQGTFVSTPSMAALGLFAQVNPYGSLKVSIEPSSLFVDAFDGATVDTTNKWTLSGTAVPTQTAGNFTLNGGTTANATSVAISQPTFTPPGLGYRINAGAITLDTVQVSNPASHTFIGVGQVTSYAYATPLTDGAGFERDSTGALNAVVYVAGTRYVINSTNPALITAQASLPTGGSSSPLAAMTWPTAGPHIYATIDRGDTMFFYIDSTDAPVAFCRNIQPQAQNLPFRMAKVNAAAAVVATSFVASGTVVGDSTSQNCTISDPTYPWRRMTIGANGGSSVTSPAKLAKSYSAAFNVVTAASATDVAVISGNATTTCYVTKITISGIQTTAGLVDTLLIKRSTADTGGTSTGQTAVSHDSTDAAASSAVLAYTANPGALGTAVGTVRRAYVPVDAALSVVGNPQVVFDFGDKGKEIILRGTAQQLAINLNAVTVTGGALDIVIEWFEV